MSTAKAWTEEENKILRRMAGEGGNSASQIGVVIGRPRNAVIGRAHRQGIKLGKGATTRPHKPKPKVRWVDGQIIRPKPTKPIEPYKNAFEPPVVAANEEPQSGGVELMSLEPHHCKWPIGDKFCGCQVIGYRKPYCQQHTYVAKGKPSGRQYIEPPRKFYR